MRAAYHPRQLEKARKGADMNEKMMEALKAEGISTREELNEAIRKEPPLDLSLMTAVPAEKAKGATA